MTRYNELFRVHCRHGYFADHCCPALTLSPTAECHRLLDRYRCLFRASRDGGAVYYGERDGQNMLRLFNEATPFAFALDNTDPELETCTEVDPRQTIAPAEGVYYFNNVRENVDTIDKVERLLLHPGGNAFAGGRLPVTPPQFVYTFPKPVREATLQLFDVFQREVWNSQTPAWETPNISLDFSSIATGRYQLRTHGPNGGAVYDFYLGGKAAGRHWGVVEIFAGGPAMAGRLPERCRVIDAKGLLCAGQSFTISMDARKSFWRYYIVSQSSADRTYGRYQIVASPPRGRKVKEMEPIGFSGPVAQEIGGKDAWVFESTTPIQLYEIPGDRHAFTLRSDSGAGGGTGSFPLPYARADNTRLESGPGGVPRMCSEIFVYL